MLTHFHLHFRKLGGLDVTGGMAGSYHTNIHANIEIESRKRKNSDI